MIFKDEIAALLSELLDKPINEIAALIEVPPQKDMGDYAFPCFFLAKTMRKAPQMIASDLAENSVFKMSWIERVQANGPYLNFYIDKSQLAYFVISDVLHKGSDYGQTDVGDNKTVIVEFSSPNIAKPFHVGHAFTTVLGHALARIYEKNGYRVVRINHLGDYGTQFGKLITAYRLWGDEHALKENPIDELLRIYVRFHEEEKNNPELTENARENFKRLESGNKEETALWQAFRDLSLKEFSQIYDRLGVNFDSYKGESFYSDKIQDVLSFLEEKNMLEDSQGAKVVMLDEYNLPPCIIVKSDGTTIYASRDIAAAMFRYEEYAFDKNIYVVGMTQALHFQQVFSVLEKGGLPYAKDCVHVGFGLVKFKNMKFSTREGNIVTLTDLIDESVSKTRDIIEKNSILRQTELSSIDIDRIASSVGIGSVVYTYLKSSREKDIIFSWEEMLDFEGDTAPYIIYTYARTRSILRKAAEKGIDAAHANDPRLKLLTQQDEIDIIKLIEGIPESIQKAAQTNEPFMVARQTARIARAFNRFYNNSSILGGQDDDQRAARLALCHAVCSAIKIGTYLLGIEVVEQM